MSTSDQRTVAQKILAAKEALVVGDHNEAYHQLYSIADPEFISFEPWQNLEAHADEASRLRDAVARLTAANKALVEALEWKTGIPPVKERTQETFWCVTRTSTGTLGTALLCYGNKFIMPLSDTCDGPPANAVPIGDDGDYEWTGWWEESCDQCDTYWAHLDTVVAWIPLPKLASYAAQTTQDKGTM